MARIGARAPLWFRSALRRPAATLTLLAVAALAVLSAATAPLLQRAVEQAALDRALTTAGTAQRSVVGVVATGSDSSPAEASAAAARVSAAIRTPGVWGPRQLLVEQTGDGLTWGPDQSVAERLTGVADCTGVRLTAGACPTATGQAVLPATTAEREGVRIGDVIALGIAPPELVVRVRVVGLYDPAVGRGALLAEPERLTTAATGVTDPDVLVAPAQLEVRELIVTAYAYRTLLPGTPVTALDAVRGDVRAAQAVSLSAAGAEVGLSVSSRLPTLLDAVDAARAAAGAVLAVVALQALVLGWFALAAVVLQTARARSAEWGLLRLRGIPRRRRAAMAALEPAAALVVGAALGLAAACLLGPALARAAVGVAVPALLPAALLSGAVALAGALVALGAALLRTARTPLPALIRRTTEPRRTTRVALVTQVVVLVATAAAVQAMLAGGGIAGDRLALLAPGLIALSAGLVAVGIAVAVVRRRSRTVPSTLAGLVLARGPARAPSRLTAAVVVTVGVALGVLVLQAAAQADRLTDAAADARAGAPIVLHVRLTTGITALGAVDRADPTGGSALAAAELRGTSVDRVVAVDTARLSAVSSWSSGWAGLSPARLHRLLVPATGPSLTITGTRLTAVLADVRTGPVDGGPGPFDVVATLQTPTGLDRVRLGRATAGSGATLTAAVPCSSGCRLVTLGATNPDGVPWSLGFTVTALRTDAQPASAAAPWLSTAGRFADDLAHTADATRPARASATASADGLRVVLRDDAGGQQPAVRVADAPQPLPALLSDTTGTLPFAGLPRTVFGTALDRTPLLLTVVGRTPALPRAMGDGVLVDLRLMQRLSDAAATAPDQEVWTTAAAAPRIQRALAGQGVRVTGRETLAEWQQRYGSAAGPVSARLAQVSGGAALLLAVVVCVGLRVIGGGARRRQWASYRSAGVGDGRLRRLVALEFLLPALGGCALGALAGLAAFALARSRLPLFDTSGGVPPVSLVPPWTLAAVVLLTAGLLAAAALLIARLETAPEAHG